MNEIRTVHFNPLNDEDAAVKNQGRHIALGGKCARIKIGGASANCWLSKQCTMIRLRKRRQTEIYIDRQKAKSKKKEDRESETKTKPVRTDHSKRDNIHNLTMGNRR